MKRLYTLALSFLVAGLLLAACDDLTKIDIPFDVTFERSLHVQGQNTAVNISDTVNLNTISSDFEKHKSSLSKADLDSMWYSVSSFQGPSTQMLTGKVQVGPSNGATMTDLYQIANFNLMQESAKGWVPMALNEAGKQKLSELVKNNPNSFKVLLVGSTNETPVEFTIKFRMKWKMVATEDAL